MKQRWIYPQNGEPFEVSHDYVQEPAGPFVMGDLPAYESPIDGRVVEGRVQRREDLRRNNCRPWEGREQEAKEASRRKQYIEQSMDSAAEATAWRAWHQLSPEKRRLLRGA